MSNNNHNDIAMIASVTAALSPARMGTYVATAVPKDDSDLSTLILYAWNAEVSGALLAPLHICEVVIRNAVSDALEAVYGPQWPWSPTFERSLPQPPTGYSPRKDLCSARRSAPTTGKLIPELKFVFWQKMFTSRHEDRLWDRHLRRVMPNLDVTKTTAELRQAIYNDLESIRQLRNRIAHHEPIFKRSLTDDYNTIRALVSYRCAVTAIWLDGNQKATAAIALNPQSPPSPTAETLPEMGTLVTMARS